MDRREWTICISVPGRSGKGPYQRVSRAGKVDVEASKYLQAGCQETGVVEERNFQEGDEQPALQLCCRRLTWQLTQQFTWQVTWQGTG